MVLITSGKPLSQQDETSCSADLARICAASLQERLTWIKVQDTNFVAHFFISWTMAPVGDLSKPKLLILLTYHDLPNTSVTGKD